MTPKEKAKELIEMFIFFASNEGTTEDGFIYSDEMQMFNAKQCALVAVDEILKIAEPSTEQVQYTNGDWARQYREIPNRYWTEVKQEIENL